MIMEKKKSFHVMKGLHAECLKMKRTVVFWIHLAFPLAGVLLFSIYYSWTQIWDALNKTSAYLQAVGAVYPFIAGVVCAGSIQLEENVGMQFLSGTGRKKEAGLLLKLGTLLLMSFLSAAVAVMGFGAVFGTVLGQDVLGMLFYFKETAAVFLCAVVLYFFHLFLSLQFSRTASIGVGIVETLISALFLTGLGDGIWYYVPCAWAARFAENLVRHAAGASMNGEIQSAVRQEIEKGTVSMAVITAAAFLLFLLWFHYYEGKREQS